MQSNISDETVENYKLVIKPVRARKLLDEIKDIWSNRELLLMFVQRDVSVRYKQATIGFLWVILQPIVMTAIFSFVFSFVARIPTEIPYPIFVMSGLIMWQYFNRCVTEGSLILVEQASVITKIYFPRMLLPLSICFSAGLDFLFAGFVLVVFIAISGVDLSLTIMLLPVFMLMAGLLAFGISLILAPINALYRDVGILLPFMVQILMFLSPVIYPVSAVPEKHQWIFMFNPISTVIESMRWAVLGSAPPPMAAYLIYGFVTFGLLIIGFKVFRNLEAKMVDRI